MQASFVKCPFHLKMFFNLEKHFILRAHCAGACIGRSQSAPELPSRRQCQISHVRSLTDVTLSAFHRHRFRFLSLATLTREGLT